MSKQNGGIIGPDNVPTGAFGAASGVWKLSDVTDYKRQGTWPVALSGHQVANSCRFNDGSSDYLTRTPSSAGNRDKWTYSAWVKRSNLTGVYQTIIQASDTGSPLNSDYLYFNSDETLYLHLYSAGAVYGKLYTNRKFRDVSAWYHIVIIYDSGNSTSSDRLQMYINGVRETSFSTALYPSQNADSVMTLASGGIDIGRDGSASGSGYYDGYMAEVCLIDGQALTPTSFGETNSATNNWVPKDVSGLTFGTTGFYLDFKDSSALGNDAAGSNNFTANNLTSLDQSIDTCTNNFLILNPLDTTRGLSDGNLTYAGAGSGTVVKGTIAVNSGKYYAECKILDASENMIGVLDIGQAPTTSYVGASSVGWGIYTGDGNLYNGASASSYSSAFSDNDIMGIALDMDNNKLYFSKNGVWQNSGDPTSGSTGTGAISITSGLTMTFCGGRDSASDTASFNFGSPPYAISSGNVDSSGMGNFEYAVPSGYYSLCTRNLNLIG